MKKTRFSILAPAIVAILSLVTFCTPTSGALLQVGDVATIQFTIDTNFGASTPDVLVANVSVSPTQPLVLTTRLLDGDVQLGESLVRSTGSFVGTAGAWKSATSLFDREPQATIDFSSIADGTIDGRIEMEVTSGSLEMTESDVGLRLIEAIAPTGGIWIMPGAVITSVTLPEPGVHAWIVAWVIGTFVRPRS